MIKQYEIELVFNFQYNIQKLLKLNALNFCFDFTITYRHLKRK